MSTNNNLPVIFLAFSNDRQNTHGYLDCLPEEARQLRDVLESAEKAGLCEIVVRTNSTATDVFKVFQDSRYRNRVAIFHYGGHANGYQLLMESATGETMAADAGGLAGFFSQQRGLQLVFLNGCSTKRQTQGLLDAKVSTVISTSSEIPDAWALNFATHFYQGLAGGASIRTAYNEAETVVQTMTTGKTRSAFFGPPPETSDHETEDQSPPGGKSFLWQLDVQEESGLSDQWRLPDAVNDPLFGLPALPELDLPEMPYRHLAWFTRADARVFFGRGPQIRDLYIRLTAADCAPILMFYGQSGVGKSSLLDAGLIPRLEKEHQVHYLRREEQALQETLRNAFLPETRDMSVLESWRKSEEAAGKPITVILDQVEEIYTRPLFEVPNELKDFLATIKQTFAKPEERPRGKLVLGFRKEWLAELEARLSELEIPRTRFFLEPLNREGIVEVVKGPSRSRLLRDRYGLSVVDDLPQIIADDLLEDHDSPIAPTLQILLTKMWNKAREANFENPEFDQKLYVRLKRDGILLRDFLDQQVAQVRMRFPDEVDCGLFLDILAAHSTPLGTADQCSVAELQQQYAHSARLPELLDYSQDLYLLTVTSDSAFKQERTTRLAHDTLAPLVRERFDESNKPGQRARRILDNRVVDWQEGQDSTPLDDADLALVENGLAGTRSLNAQEQKLVNASREQRAVRKRTRTILKIVALFLFVGIAVTSFLANQQRKAAQVEAQEAGQIKDFFIHHLQSERVARFGQDYSNVDRGVKDLMIRDQIKRADIHNQLGNVLIKLADIEKAKSQQSKAMLILEDEKVESPDRSLKIASVKVNMALINSLEGRYDESLELVDEAIEIFQDLELDPYDEPMLSATVLRWMSLSASKQGWDEEQNKKIQIEFDAALKKLAKGQDEPRLAAAITIVRGLGKIQYADSPHSNLISKAVLGFKGMRIFKKAKKMAAGVDPDDPTLVGLKLFDVMKPYWYGKLKFWATTERKEVEAQSFIQTTDEFLDELGATYGHTNPGILDIRLARAEMISDHQLKERMLLDTLGSARRVLGKTPAYAKFVYAYTDFLGKRAVSEKSVDARATHKKREALLSDLFGRLEASGESGYRLGYAQMKLGRVLKARNQSRRAKERFEVAWKLFMRSGVQDFSQLGGLRDFDEFR